MRTRSGPFSIVAKNTTVQRSSGGIEVNAHKLKSLPHDEKLRLYLHYSNLMFGFMRQANKYFAVGDYITGFRTARRNDRIIHKRLIRLWGVLTLGERREFDDVLSQALKHRE